MNLIDLVQRTPVPAPWSEGDNIPWNDPGFSERMLQEHLSQIHDAASRRYETIDAHVAWIENQVLDTAPQRILDLGCGPGLYTSRFAELGHHPRGIDFGPASIAYANQNSSVQHVLADVRSADFGSDNDLVMMIFGEINVFRRSDAVMILSKARQSLADGGKVLLEAHTPEAVKLMGFQPPSWRTREHGLFSGKPHLLLEENFWDPDQCAATTRYFVVDADTGKVTRYASSMQQYGLTEYECLFGEAGLKLERTEPALDGSGVQGDFVVLVGSRKL
jgi:SAM-dependent methyltransferase